MEEINKEEKKVENNDQEKTAQEKKDNQMKNLISLVILASGLFLGSLFVDIGQLVKGAGYSQKNLNRSEIFEANGRTWVAYIEPAVPVSIISDEKCEKCDPGEVLVWLKRVVPTISAQKIDFESEEGKKIISEYNVKTLPAFIFHKDVEKTELFSQAQELFSLKNEKYSLNTQALGVRAGKYLSVPSSVDGNARFGKAESSAKVIIFSDFGCPYCKLFHENLKSVMKDYSDKAQFIFKQLPLGIHPEAEAAANASLCALEQNKFWEYADELYARQTEWGNAKGVLKFKDYARKLRMDSGKFNACLDSNKFQSQIDADKKEAEEFGITGTPTIFVGNQSESGAIEAGQLKMMIEASL